MTARPPTGTVSWVVADASVWVSRLVPGDVHHEASRRWLEQHTAGGGFLVAPVILFVEVAGAIARRTGQPSLAQQAEAQLWKVAQLRVAPVSIALGRKAAHLAAQLRLHGADAVYVAVADSLHVPLVTWDTEQNERAATVIATHTPASLTSAG